ncbi:MAG: hypothetical protein ACTSV5_04535 [Promethearchaeota archaeon]
MFPQDDAEDINALREQVNELNKELNKRNNEIVFYSEKTHILEDEIIKLRELLPDEPSKKKGKKVKETKLQLEIDAKNQEMRELKTRMSYLRIENINIQKELKKLKGSGSTVINVEDLREKTPLNILVKELQEKINKQESLIRRFQHDNRGTSDFQDVLKTKDIEIENLKNTIQDLEESYSKPNKLDDDRNGDITKKILTDLQEKLNKLKRQNEELKYKIEQKSKTEDLGNKDRVIELEDEIKTLKSQLNNKDNEINHQEGPLEQVVEELQNKLNKAKSKINILQDQLQAQNITSSPSAGESHIGTIDKIKMQRDLASFLQQQLDDAKKALKTKVEEIGTIKNEAIRIKRRYEDLETQIQFKDKSIRELRNDLDTLKLQTQLHSTPKQEENPSYELRLQELKSMVEDLTKQNIQQRLEINQLRKNI